MWFEWILSPTFLTLITRMLELEVVILDKSHFVLSLIFLEGLEGFDMSILPSVSKGWRLWTSWEPWSWEGLVGFGMTWLLTMTNGWRLRMSWKLCSGEGFAGFVMEILSKIRLEANWMSWEPWSWYGLVCFAIGILSKTWRRRFTVEEDMFSDLTDDSIANVYKLPYNFTQVTNSRANPMCMIS